MPSEQDIVDNSSLRYAFHAAVQCLLRTQQLEHADEAMNKMILNTESTSNWTVAGGVAASAAIMFKRSVDDEPVLVNLQLHNDRLVARVQARMTKCGRMSGAYVESKVSKIADMPGACKLILKQALEVDRRVVVQHRPASYNNQYTFTATSTSSNLTGYRNFIHAI